MRWRLPGRPPKRTENDLEEDDADGDTEPLTAPGFGAISRQAQRALLIQVGAAATVGEKVRETARTYSNVGRVVRELDRFERRGARALSRRQRAVSRQRRELEHDVRGARRDIENRAEDAAERVKRLV